MKENTKKLVEFLDKSGIEYTIDSEPTEEKINKITKKISENEERVKMWVKKNGQGLIEDIKEFNGNKKK